MDKVDTMNTCGECDEVAQTKGGSKVSETLETDYCRCGNCDLWRLRDIVDGKWDWVCPQSPDKDENEEACNRWREESK